MRLHANWTAYLCPVISTVASKKSDRRYKSEYLGNRVGLRQRRFYYRPPVEIDIIMAYRIALLAMTLNYFQGHSPIANRFTCDFCTVVQQLRIFQFS